MKSRALQRERAFRHFSFVPRSAQKKNYIHVSPVNMRWARMAETDIIYNFVDERYGEMHNKWKVRDRTCGPTTEAMSAIIKTIDIILWWRMQLYAHIGKHPRELASSDGVYNKFSASFFILTRLGIRIRQATNKICIRFSAQMPPNRCAVSLCTAICGHLVCGSAHSSQHAHSSLHRN